MWTIANNLIDYLPKNDPVEIDGCRVTKQFNEVVGVVGCKKLLQKLEKDKYLDFRDLKEFVEMSVFLANIKKPFKCQAVRVDWFSIWIE